MQISRTFLFVLLLLAYLAVGSFFAYRVVDKSIDYQRNMQAYTDDLNYQERLLKLESWVKGEEDEKVLERAGRKKERAEAEFSKARQAAWILAAVSIAFLALAQLISARHISKRKWRASALLAVALIALLVGLCSPMMEIGAFERDLSIPIRLETRLFSLNMDHVQVFKGDIYFYYQSKSIVALISLLFKQGNWVVGSCIFAFSLLIPFVKILFSFLHIWEVPLTQHPFLQKIMLKIAKWSMADVFVAAVFLAFLAFNNMETGIQTQSRTLIGLYFFLTYVLLSVWNKAISP